MIYSIHYDLKRPGQNYAELLDAIRSCGDWWHYLGSTWLVDGPLNAAQIWERLAPHVDTNDRVLIIGVTKEYWGWLPQDAWDWLDSRGYKMAA